MILRGPVNSPSSLTETLTALSILVSLDPTRRKEKDMGHLQKQIRNSPHIHIPLEPSTHTPHSTPRDGKIERFGFDQMLDR